MKVLLICNTANALYVFRGPLIRELLRLGHEVVTLSGPDESVDKLRDMGVTAYTIDFPRHKIGVWQNLKLIYQIFVRAKTLRPDVLHAFTHKAVVYGLLTAAILRVRKPIGTVTGLGTLFSSHALNVRLIRLLLIWQYRLLVPNRAILIFQNPDDLNEMKSVGCVGGRRAVVTYGSGIDLQEYRVPTDVERRIARHRLSTILNTDIEAARVILLPARCVREKGCFEYYEAAKSLSSERCTPYCFLHVGLIDAQSPLDLSGNQIMGYAALHSVHYLGYWDDMRLLITAADVVALPSYREGVPRALIEALALGKLIVTTDAPGCRETVIDSWNGYLCKPQSSDALAQAFSRVTAHDIQLAKTRSRQLACQKFDVRELNKMTVSLYSS